METIKFWLSSESTSKYDKVYSNKWHQKKLIILSDAPSLCVKITQSNIECVEQAIPKHSIYQNEEEMFFPARDIMLMMRASNVYMSADSTFPLYAHMGYGVLKKIPGKAVRKMLPICPNCKDKRRLSSSAYGWCHKYRVQTFSGTNFSEFQTPYEEGRNSVAIVSRLS